MKWEYFVKDLYSATDAESHMSILNHFGNQGWRLVQILDIPNVRYAFFERLLPEVPTGEIDALNKYYKNRNSLV